MTRLFRWVKCRLALHCLRVVHSCSQQAQHVRCVHCHREYGIHHGLRVVVPWSTDLCVCKMVEEWLARENP
jgi:hypothetical protein